MTLCHPLELQFHPQLHLQTHALGPSWFTVRSAQDIALSLGALCPGPRRVTRGFRACIDATAAEKDKSPIWQCTWPDSPDNRSCSKPLCTVFSWTNASRFCQLDEGLNSLQNQLGGLVCVSALPRESCPGFCYSRTTLSLSTGILP